MRLMSGPLFRSNLPHTSIYEYRSKALPLRTTPMLALKLFSPENHLLLQMILAFFRSSTRLFIRRFCIYPCEHVQGLTSFFFCLFLLAIKPVPLHFVQFIEVLS